MKETPQARLKRIKRSVSAILGEKVVRIETPGGTTRASCRVVLQHRTVIATSRNNFRRTVLEGAILEALSPACPRIPQFLGIKDNVMVQSDVGGARLGHKIRDVGPAAQIELAAQAIEGIFQIHAAGRTALEGVPVPPLGCGDAWLRSHAESILVLKEFGSATPDRIDLNDATEALRVEPLQFVKWDCRSGNAALDPNGQVNWFDFEYCGKRHGADDLAWLIADESWPLPAETMLDIVADLMPQRGTAQGQAYLDYLCLYTTFHAAQRLGLILRSTRRKGWRSKTGIVASDDVGRHPQFARNICETGRFMAERNALTRPLVPGFDRAARFFDGMLAQSKAG